MAQRFEGNDTEREIKCGREFYSDCPFNLNYLFISNDVVMRGV